MILVIWWSGSLSSTSGNTARAGAGWRSACTCSWGKRYGLELAPGLIVTLGQLVFGTIIDLAALRHRLGGACLQFIAKRAGAIKQRDALFAELSQCRIA